MMTNNKKKRGTGWGTLLCIQLAYHFLKSSSLGDGYHVWFPSAVEVTRISQRCRFAPPYLLIIVCCLFISCRTVESGKDWNVQSWPEPYPDFIISEDWVAYEQRNVLMDMRITKLESTVARLDRENEMLMIELEEQIDWHKFWKRIAKIFVKGEIK